MFVKNSSDRSFLTLSIVKWLKFCLVGLFFFTSYTPAAKAKTSTQPLPTATPKTLTSVSPRPEVTNLSLKDWVDIVNGIFQILGIIGIVILAWIRWGPGAGPRLMFRNIIFLPPGSVPDISSQEIVIAADVIFSNPYPFPEYVEDITLTIIENECKNISSYSAFIYAKPDAFLDKDKTPDWVTSFFHPLYIYAHKKDDEIEEQSKNIIFFSDKNKSFNPRKPGEYTLEAKIKRYTVFFWRKNVSDKFTFSLDQAMINTLKNKEKNQEKISLLSWHLKSKNPRFFFLSRT